MALLSAEEQAKYKEQGLWIKEKCDACNRPILELSYTTKGGGTICPICKKGKNLVSLNLKEEMDKNMAKTEKKKNAGSKDKAESKKVMGIFVAGTALAELAVLLQDQKKHAMAEIKKICAKHKKDAPGRLGNLKRVGLKKEAFGLIIDEDTVQMKLGKMSKSELAAATPKKEKAEEKTAAKKKVNGHAPEEKEEVSSKQQQTTQRLLRKTLKDKKDWRKNSLIEHVAKEHDLETKRVSAALTAEIKAGGIKDNKGVMELV